MAIQVILKACIHILAFPWVGISRAVLWLGLGRFQGDLQKCLAVVDGAPSIPDRFVVALVAAEDHRNPIHPGIDPIAMLRALYVWGLTGRVQGASTIEQQLVRVVLARYEKTLRRKFVEQLVAIALCCNRPKTQIAKAYLGGAFYGSGLYGVAAIAYVCETDLEAASLESVAYAVARLKYPEPTAPSDEWRRKIDLRMRYVIARLGRAREGPNAVVGTFSESR